MNKILCCLFKIVYWHWMKDYTVEKVLGWRTAYCKTIGDSQGGRQRLIVCFNILFF